MNEQLSYEFWLRVDEKKGNLTVTQICKDLNLKYNRIRDNRSENRLPNIDDLIRIADYLHTDVNYLLTSRESFCNSPEIEYVRTNPQARALIRAIMRDEHLLAALSLVIESYERNENKNEEKNKLMIFFLLSKKLGLYNIYKDFYKENLKMKKSIYLLLIVFAIVTLCTSCATINKEDISSFSQIITVDGKSKDELFVASASWFVDAFRDSKSVLEISDLYLWRLL